MKKRIFSSLALTLAVLLLFGACTPAPGGDSSQTSEEPGQESSATSSENGAESQASSSAETSSVTVSSGTSSSGGTVSAGTSSSEGTKVDVKSLVRKTTAKNYNTYDKEIAGYKLTDPSVKTEYSDAEKDAQRKAGRTMGIRVQKALNEGKHTYKVEPGVYRIPDGQIPFEFTGMKDFYLDISDCTFILEGRQNLIRLTACDNVIIQGPCSVERDPLLITQFKIISYNKSTQKLTVQLMEGYTIPAHLEAQGGNFQWFTEDGKMLPTAFISFSNAQMLDKTANTAVFNGVGCWADMRDDDRLVPGQIGATAVSGHVAQVINLKQSRNIQIRDITNYGSGMMTLIQNEYGPDVLDKLYNVRQPGTNRLVAGTAGQMTYMEGGPAITNCIFSFCEDDSIDIMGHSHFVYQQESSDTIIIKPQENYAPVKVGDTINIYDYQDFEKKSTAKVVSFEIVDDEEMMTNARNQALNNYGYMATLSTFNCVRIKLDRKVSARIGDTFENETSFRPTNVSIKNCYFHDYGCRVLVQGCNGLTIENNRMERAGLAAIALDMEEAAWTEGPSSTNVVIKNNTIKDSPCSPYVTHWPFVLNGAISVGPSQFYEHRSPSTETDVFHNITITGNKIYNANYSGILVKNATGVTVTDNLIQNAVHMQVPTRRPEASGTYIFDEEPLYGIYFFACEKITEKGNTFKDMGSESLGNVRKKDCK